MTFHWVPSEWAKPDKYRWYPLHYLQVAIALILTVVFFTSLIPALILTIVGAGAIVLGVGVSAILLFIASAFAPNIAGEEQYEYLRNKYGDE